MGLSYIELFAGCGGMSLGLDSTGMERLFSNELSPMAGQTYAYNLLGYDLDDAASRRVPLSGRPVRWLQSRYPERNLEKRLLENPLEFSGRPFLEEMDGESLKGSLVIGDIRELNRYEEERGSLLASEAVDVVSGGPPCQSFSMAGLRQYGNQRNRLPWEFANFVERHDPRLVVLENVSGIMRPFKGDDGEQVHVWFEVAKAFAAKGYAPICLHVNAARVGVAQNRPRFLMFAVRSDQVDMVRKNLGIDAWALQLGEELLASSSDATFQVSNPCHRVIDLTGDSADLVLSDGPLAKCFRVVDSPVAVDDAIDDLAPGEMVGQSEYARGLGEIFDPYIKHVNHGETTNHKHRDHTPKVQARFRFYQIVEVLKASDDESRSAAGSDLFKAVKGNLDKPVANSQLEMLMGVPDLPLLSVRLHPVSEVGQARAVVAELVTHKHSQRALRRSRPAPAALSIPDDACHYELTRTLSVREMARIQSFPDSFVFRSLPTTGGTRRRFQVPQYTQVGNAVPPRLSRQIGLFVQTLLADPPDFQ